MANAHSEVKVKFSIDMASHHRYYNKLDLFNVVWLNVDIVAAGVYASNSNDLSSETSLIELDV